jgi:PRTRC genetic system ThiF family protein
VGTNSNAPRDFIAPLQGLTDPVHKIHCVVIGAGGTGSQVMQGLGAMNHALECLGHPGFYVTLYDSDIVTEFNLGRQLFNQADLGKNKADVMIEKVNRFYGTSWKSCPEDFTERMRVGYQTIYFTCVDKVAPRKHLHKILTTRHRTSNFDWNYWMDFGNGRNTGQVILGSYSCLPINLKSVGDIGIPEFDDNETPSCSLAEALTKQDLMINRVVANLGLTMLWSAFSELKFKYNSIYINLGKMKVTNSLDYEKTTGKRKRA